MWDLKSLMSSKWTYRCKYSLSLSLLVEYAHGSQHMYVCLYVCMFVTFSLIL